jgi:ammonium transporter, Amt family
VYIAGAMLMLALRIDDPLEAFPIHGCVGFWGIMAGTLFARKEHMTTAGFAREYWGLFYGGGFKFFLSNLFAAFVTAAWTLGLLLPFFYVLNFAGILRISAEEEIIGNDVSKHGGVAYPIDSAIAAEKAAAREVDNLGMDDSLKLPNV